MQAWVSLCRAEKFLSVPEVIQPDTVTDEGFVIRAVDASFSWSDTGLCIAALVNSEWILILLADHRDHPGIFLLNRVQMRAVAPLHFATSTYSLALET